MSASPTFQPPVTEIDLPGDSGAKHYLVIRIACPASPPEMSLLFGGTRIATLMLARLLAKTLQMHRCPVRSINYMHELQNALIMLELDGSLFPLNPVVSELAQVNLLTYATIGTCDLLRGEWRTHHPPGGAIRPLDEREIADDAASLKALFSLVAGHLPNKVSEA